MSTVDRRVLRSVEHVGDEVPLAERALRFAAIAYVFTIPLDAQTFFTGRSWSSIAGFAMIVLWALAGISAGLGNSRVATRRVAAQPSAAPLVVGIVFFFLVVVLKFPSAWEPELGVSRLISFAALTISILAIRRAFDDGSRTPIYALISGTTLLGVVLILGAVRSLAQSADYRSTSFALNQNQAAAITAVGLLFTCLLLLDLNPRARFAALLAVLIQVLGILSTGSRTGFFMLIFAALLVPIISTSEGDRRLKRLAGSIGLVALTFLVVWLARGWLPSRLTSAVDALLQGDLTGREDIWAETTYYAEEWWPWGVGLGNDVLVTSLATGSASDLHNTFLWSAVELGLLGLIGVVSIFLATLLVARYSPYKSYVWVGMLPILVFSFSTTLFHFKILWVLMALASVRSPSGLRADPDSRSLSARDEGLSQHE